MLSKISAAGLSVHILFGLIGAGAAQTVDCSKLSDPKQVLLLTGERYEPRAKPATETYRIFRGFPTKVYLLGADGAPLREVDFRDSFVETYFDFVTDRRTRIVRQNPVGKLFDLKEVGDSVTYDVQDITNGSPGPKSKRRSTVTKAGSEELSGCQFSTLEIEATTISIDGRSFIQAVSAFAPQIGYSLWSRLTDADGQPISFFKATKMELDTSRR